MPWDLDREKKKKSNWSDRNALKLSQRIIFNNSKENLIARWFQLTRPRKGKCNVSKIINMLKPDCLYLMGFCHLNLQRVKSHCYAEDKKLLWAQEPHRAPSHLQYPTNSCYPDLWESSSWCFVTWCCVYISRSNEFVPCWKWSHVGGH